MLLCFLAGRATRLSHNARGGLVPTIRVSAGGMMSSTQPYAAATGTCQRLPVLPGEQPAQRLRILRAGQVPVEQHVNSAGGAHHADLRGGPCEADVGTEFLGTHHGVATPECLAHD